MQLERIWRISAEYKTGSTVILDSSASAVSLAGYTKDNYYDLLTALHKIKSNSKAIIQIKFLIPETGTAPKQFTLTLDNNATYHRLVMYTDAAGKIVFAVQGYNAEGAYLGDTIYTTIYLAAENTFKLNSVGLYSGTNHVFDVYTHFLKSEYEDILDHDSENYLFSNEANTVNAVTDTDHLLQTGLIEYTNVEVNKEIDLPFYAIRKTYEAGYAQIKIAYSKGGAEEVVKDYSSSKLAFRYVKVGYIQKASTIYVVIYTYDKDRQLVERKEVSLGTTGGFDSIRLQLKGIYCNVARMLNYKQAVKEVYPITHYYNTRAKVTANTKNSHNVKVSTKVISRDSYLTKAVVKRTVRNLANVKDKVTANAKNSFNVNITTKVIARDSYNTRTVVKKTVRNLANTRAKVTVISKKAFNTAAVISTKAVTSHNTITKTVCNFRDSYLTKSTVKKTVKDSYNTKATVVANVLVRTPFNVKIATVYGSKILANSRVNVKGYVRNAHNTLFKPLISVRNSFNTEVNIKTRVRTKHAVMDITKYDSLEKFNTASSIVNRVRASYNVKATVKPVVKTNYNCVTKVSKDYRTEHNTKAKTIVRVKEKFNTKSRTFMVVARSFNITQSIDIVNVIKMLLGITDSSKDPILKYLISKAIDDMQVYCNLLDNELITSKSGLPLTAGYFPSDSQLGSDRKLQTILIDLVIYYYQMQGMQHLKSESVEGASWSYISDEIPKQLQIKLKAYKKMRALRVF